MKVMQRKSSSHKGYFATLGVSGILMATLIIGSISSVAEAYGRYNRFTEPTVQRSDRSRQSNSTTNNQSSRNNGSGASTNKAATPTPAQTQTTTTSPAPTQTVAPVTPVAPTQPQAPVVTSQPKAPAPPPDTAVDSQLTSTAQANSESIVTPVTYTSQQISDELRDRLIMLAGVLAVSGLALYGITFVGAKSVARPIPVRRVIPVEVIS